MAKVQITHIKLNEIVIAISYICCLELLLKKPTIIVSSINQNYSKPSPKQPDKSVSLLIS